MLVPGMGWGFQVILIHSLMSELAQWKVVFVFACKPDQAPLVLSFPVFFSVFLFYTHTHTFVWRGSCSYLIQSVLSALSV